MRRYRKMDFVVSRDTVHVTPGQMLASLRELQGFSQNELARRTGMSQANISQMENGRQQIGRDRAMVLSHALKVHPSVILFPDFVVEAEAA